MDDITHIESGRQPTQPEFKSFLPPTMNEDGLSDGEREARTIHYVIEDISVESPYFREYGKKLTSYLPIIAVVTDERIIYTTSFKTHGFLRQAEKIDPINTETYLPNGTNITLTNWQNGENPSINLHGFEEQVSKTLDFLLRSGYSPDCKIDGSFRKDNAWKRIKGTLGNPEFHD